MDRLVHLLDRIGHPRALADLFVGAAREDAGGVARRLAAVLSSPFEYGSGSMEIALKIFVLIVQLSLAGFILWGAYLCLSAWIQERRGAHAPRAADAEANAPAPAEPSFERVTSLVLLALLCTTLAGVA